MRNEFDILKSFAILLVVLGHVTTMYRPQGLFDGIQVNTTLAAITSVIYIFHMPLFIALSGAVYEYGIGRGKYWDFKSFIVNKVKRIIVPCVFIGVCVLSPTLYLIKDISVTSCLYDIYILGG